MLRVQLRFKNKAFNSPLLLPRPSQKPQILQRQPTDDYGYLISANRHICTTLSPTENATPIRETPLGMRMRVFIAIAVGMSTFFAASALGFPRHTRTQRMSRVPGEKIHRFPLLTDVPLPCPLLVSDCDATDEQSGTFYSSMRFSFYSSVIPPLFHSTKNGVKVRAQRVHPGG